MRFLQLFLVAMVLASCSAHSFKGEEERFRESLKTSTPTITEAVYKIIDTSKIYKLVASYYKYDSNQTNVVAEYNYKKYLKFYKDGKLAVFDDFDLTSIDTLKAKVTDHGYYDYTYNTLYTRHHLTNKSGKQFYNPQVHQPNGDTLSLYSQSTKSISHYLAIAIPANVVVAEAEW